MLSKHSIFIVLAAFVLITISPRVPASPDPTTAQADVDEQIYSPHVGGNYPDQVFFGDTHFHTEVSFDAGLIGTNLDIRDAFRFARGEKVVSNTRQPVQLIRPLIQDRACTSPIWYTP